LEREVDLLKARLERIIKAWKAKSIRQKEEIKQKKQKKK